MTSPTKTFLLLGASGDLAGRLLLPALGDLLDAEPQRRDVVLVGAGVEDWDDATWKERVRSSFTAAEVSARDARRGAGDHPVPADRRHRRGRSGPAARGLRRPARPLLRPAAGRHGRRLRRRCVDVELPEGTVLALEKPFGTDAESAAELNRLLTDLVPEDQVHRVDHFLGRSTVLNLLGPAVRQPAFEPLWSNLHIERVDHRLRRAAGPGEPGPLLRQGRRPGRHDPEPPAAGAGPGRDGAAGLGGRGDLRDGQGRRCCAPAGSGATTRREPAGGRATPPAPSTGARCPTTSTSPGWTRPATPRPWPR